MSDRPPDIPDQLGQRIASYTPLPRSRRRARWQIALIAGLSLVAAGAVWQQVRLPWLPAVSMALAIAIFIRERCIGRTQRIELFQRGLAWSIGRRRHVLYWNELRDVYRTRQRRGSDRNLVWSCRLVRHDGRQWRLRGIEGLGSLGLRVEAALMRHLLPGTVQAFREGYPVWFGPRLAFNRSGLQIHSKSLAWHGVREIALEEGRGLRIVGASDKPEVFHLTAAEVPNLSLLAAFLEAIRDQAAASQRTESPAEATARPDSDLLTGPEGGSTLGNDPSDLLLAGFDWEDIRSVMQGEVSLEDLLARGPRHRPRHPR